MSDLEEVALQQAEYRRVYLDGVVSRPTSCDERACRHIYIDQPAGAPIWTFWHANGRVYAQIPVPTALVEDTPAWHGVLPGLIEQAHEAMDYQEQQRPLKGEPA